MAGDAGPAVQAVTTVTAAQLDSWGKAARASIRQERYDRALAVLRELAAKGDPRGEYGLGLMAANGCRVKKDDGAAVSRFRKAAQAGVPEARSAPGTRYDAGRGVRQDIRQAVFWYEKAASGGDGRARARLGT
ncbi:tetratricopeptide repeat protein [Oxalobacter paraformigenes]|nr:SEL1-like repeat protein [Oxalobacter paraformigenes]